MSWSDIADEVQVRTVITKEIIVFIVAPIISTVDLSTMKVEIAPLKEDLIVSIDLDRVHVPLDVTKSHRATGQAHVIEEEKKKRSPDTEGHRARAKEDLIIENIAVIIDVG